MPLWRSGRGAGPLLVLLALFALFAGGAHAQPSAPGLLRLWDAALAHDPVWRAALKEQQAAQELVPLAVGARRPEASLTATAARNQLDQRAGAFSRSPSYTSSSLGVQLRQPLINRDLESREAQAVLRARQADAVLAARRLQLSERLVDAWVQLAQASALVEISGTELQRQLELVRAAERTLAAGEGTATDVLEAASRAELLRAELRAAETARDNAAESLERIAGPAARGLAPQLAPAAQAHLPEPAGNAAAQPHPEVLAAEIGVALANEGIQGAKAPYRPRLDLSAGASRADSDVVNTVNQVNVLRSVGVQFSMPLYDGGREDSATRQAVLLAGKAAADLDDAAQAVQQRLAQARRTLATSRQRLDALRAARASTEQLIGATRRSIAGGVRSRLDLLLAERQLGQVLRDEQAALADHLRAWWRLQTARADAGEPQLQQLSGAFRLP